MEIIKINNDHDQAFPVVTLKDLVKQCQGQPCLHIPQIMSNIGKHNLINVDLYYLKNTSTQDGSKDQASPANNLLDEIKKLAQIQVEKAICSELFEVAKSEQQKNRFETHNLALSDPTLKKTDLQKSAFHWKDKILSQAAPLAFYNDLIPLIDKSNTNFGLGVTLQTPKLTLFVPTSHMPYLMAQTSTYPSALDMLTKTYPKLKIIAIPELSTKSDSFILAVRDNDAFFGKAGYFILQDDIRLSAPDEISAPGTIMYTLTIPAHKIFIKNPEQIAVLTGI